MLIIGAIASVTQSGATECTKWDVGGQWVMNQSNKILVTVDLRQNGDVVTGTASYPGRKGVIHGSVDGTVNPPFVTKSGDLARAKGAPEFVNHPQSLTISIYWDYGETGVYIGDIGPRGRIEGSGYIKQDAKNAGRQWAWFSNRTMNCASPGSTAPSAPAPTPDTRPVHKVKKSGSTDPANSAEATQWDRAVALEAVSFPDNEGNQASLQVNKIYPIRRITPDGLIKVFDRVTGKEVNLLPSQARLLKPGEKFKPSQN